MVTINYKGAIMEIAEKGAEVRRFKSAEGRECLWSGDKDVWGGVSPILFPIAGPLINNTITINGKPYSIPKHGFARNMEFKLIEQGDNFATLELTENEESLSYYPFAFSLQLTHRILDNGFETVVVITNKNDSTMPFTIGGHAGFTCPMKDGEKFTDYALYFEKPEKGECIKCGPNDPTTDIEVVPLGENNDCLTLEYEKFDARDTYLFRDIQSECVCLLNKETKKGIQVSFSKVPVLAIWTASFKKAPYLCIEPWEGTKALTDETGRFEDKPYMVHLPAGEKHTFFYRMQEIN